MAQQALCLLYMRRLVSGAGEMAYCILLAAMMVIWWLEQAEEQRKNSAQAQEEPWAGRYSGQPYITKKV